jgi:hypothetical protein
MNCNAHVAWEDFFSRFSGVVSDFLVRSHCKGDTRVFWRPEATGTWTWTACPWHSHGLTPYHAAHAPVRLLLQACLLPTEADLESFLHCLASPEILRDAGCTNHTTQRRRLSYHTLCWLLPSSPQNHWDRVTCLHTPSYSEWSISE